MWTQVQTQTGDDDSIRYVQTEGPDQETVWTQIPCSGSFVEAKKRYKANLEAGWVHS